MSAEVVNLRNFRKRKARAEREAEAAANRAKFGRSKSERELTDKSADLENRRLDQAKLPDDLNRDE